MGFAIYEMGLALSYIVRRYHIISRDSDIKINPLITLKPVGVVVTFSKR